MHPSVPAKSVRELIALANAKPGLLKCSSANLHVAAEMFKNMSGTNMIHEPYKGGGPALTAILGGECDLSFLALVAVLPHINAGKVRALAITSTTHSAVLRGLPTVAEAGVPAYEFSSWVGILAPASTPADIVSALHAYIAKAMHSPDVTERFTKEGADVIASSPPQFGAYIKAELARWSKVVKESGMKAD